MNVPGSFSMYAIRGCAIDTAPERSRGAVWVLAVGLVASLSLYWYLS